MGEPLTLIDEGSRRLRAGDRLLLCSDGVQSLTSRADRGRAALPVQRPDRGGAGGGHGASGQCHGHQAGTGSMSKNPVVIEVTRGPVVESRHEGIAAVVKADGTVVASWGDIDAPILPRSANKPIQAMAFVESGAVERFGLGNEHIALSCASHNGEPRHVETVRAWLKKVGLGEDDLECGTHAPRLQASIEALVRENALPTAAYNNCSGKHSGFLTHGRRLRRADQGLHQVRPSGAAPAARGHDRPLRQRRR